MKIKNCQIRMVLRSVSTNRLIVSQLWMPRGIIIIINYSKIMNKTSPQHLFLNRKMQLVKFQVFNQVMDFVHLLCRAIHYCKGYKECLDLIFVKKSVIKLVTNIKSQFMKLKHNYSQPFIEFATGYNQIPDSYKVTFVYLQT